MNLEHIIRVREPFTGISLNLPIRRVHPGVIHLEKSGKLYLKSNSLCFRSPATGRFKKLNVQVY